MDQVLACVAGVEKVILDVLRANGIRIPEGWPDEKPEWTGPSIPDLAMVKRALKALRRGALVKQWLASDAPYAKENAVLQALLFASFSQSLYTKPLFEKGQIFQNQRKKATESQRGRYMTDERRALVLKLGDDPRHKRKCDLRREVQKRLRKQQTHEHREEYGEIKVSSRLLDYDLDYTLKISGKSQSS
jgi:hypothetical protein